MQSFFNVKKFKKVEEMGRHTIQIVLYLKYKLYKK